ncbi:acyl--CoA ligase [Jannaschia seohaensis]|uniref:Acyl-CoA synthetase (AMP-forming)/AMP-acid ligase II n=1 Tax=Jannaschia seohaensis TaxID=475081 RepID=A0A2Y9ANE6_9RHOB|nr:acyl--CoA ligase [Jannaschia seohaensis]PWJ19329.1 acyl-CoA synthetase (AMP-forming)/AMP-acid ligase II [Jannaschia seohaensis]SSA45991.1 Acyl-CoA synthetase (AMP-forming)/AMP-acid ligase II [Jannaschia seohaensis]
MADTIAGLIADHDSGAPAIGAPGRDWTTYGALRQQSDAVRGALRAAGVGAADRVAIVLPNGPEMAVAFVTVAQAATTAPLNPAYKEEEFAFYLEDLGAKAIIVAAGAESPARAAAEGQGLTVIELTADETGPAGAFTLAPVGETNPATEDGTPGPDGVALILHTSGTTSRPKIVPLLQSNVAASAGNIAASLKLTAEDRCLNVMPLFHIHGLVAAVGASLAAGASISCSPGFDALRFFGWLDEVDPTWYTAVPTMHQAILARAKRNTEIIEKARLRFLRSSSASLPGPVMTQLAETFGAPVVEAYGMTEAAHQMCSNPVEPGRQKPGMVGLAAGPEVRVAHETEDRLVEGVGEVVISGPNVTPGYESNPDANAKSFFEAEGKRWFRTGDQGAFDEDGYLGLTGRLKEIINRGGEKVSPLEVDGILSDHPAIAQCVTFAVPHPKLGEEVAAAVVLRDGASATEREIRDFAAERLAAFKVPRQVLILDEIPKGATGKLQRIGLAEKLGLGS